MSALHVALLYCKCEITHISSCFVPRIPVLTRISAFSDGEEITLKLLLPFHSPTFTWLCTLTANRFNRGHNLCLQKNVMFHSLFVSVLELWHMTALNDFCFLRMTTEPADRLIILLFHVDRISFGLCISPLYKGILFAFP